MCQLPVAGAGSCASSSTSVQGCDKDQLRERERERGTLRQSVIKFDCLEGCFILNISDLII